jgi:hypothetical protein
MRRSLVAALVGGLMLVSSVPALAAGPPAGAGSMGKPAGVACQQFGVGVLQSQGLLAAVAANGLEYPIGSGEIVPFRTVLEIHRTDPALANQVLTDYAVALGIATPEVVAALNAACPTG